MTTNREGWLTEEMLKKYLATPDGTFNVEYEDGAANVNALCRMALAALELKAKVAGLEYNEEYTNKWVAGLTADRDSLRAQLEAAKADAERLADAIRTAEDTSQKERDALEAHDLNAPQHTAQPDGVRLAAYKMGFITGQRRTGKWERDAVNDFNDMIKVWADSINKDLQAIEVKP